MNRMTAGVDSSSSPLLLIWKENGSEDNYMPGRGPQTFKKRQKEQQRKERSQEKFAKRMERKAERASGASRPEDDDIDYSAATTYIPPDARSRS